MRRASKKDSSGGSQSRIASNFFQPKVKTINSNSSHSSNRILSNSTTSPDLTPNIRVRVKSNLFTSSNNGFEEPTLKEIHPNTSFSAIGLTQPDETHTIDLTQPDETDTIDLTQPDSKDITNSLSSISSSSISINEPASRSSSITSIASRSTSTTSITPKKRKPQVWDNFIHNGRKATKTQSFNSLAKPSSNTNYKPIELSEDQKKVLQYVKNDENIFFTGAAGTGKSFLLGKIIEELYKRYSHSSVAVTATTGLAGLNIKGTTVHKWAGIGLGIGPCEELIKTISRSKLSRERWHATKVLIIDELSMLDGELFTKLNTIGKLIRKSDKPFGGIQLILTGDFYQLPPVSKGGTSRFCFATDAWKAAIKRKVELRTIFRQQGDQELIQMLSALRQNNLTNDMINKFKSLERRIDYEDGIAPVELYPTKREVSAANVHQLNRLKGKLFKFKSIDYYKDEFHKKLLDNVMVDEVLDLKLNSQVLLVVNQTDELVNGSQGKVVSFVNNEDVWAILENNKSALEIYTNIIQTCPENGDFAKHIEEYMTVEKSKLLDKDFEVLNRIMLLSRGDLYPVVEFHGKGRGITRVILPHEFSQTTPPPKSDVLATRRQLPLILSWALSIHKAQGQTLERVKVNLAKSFEAGQVYVAISRATSTKGLEIYGFSRNAVKVREEVVNFYKSFNEEKEYND